MANEITIHDRQVYRSTVTTSLPISTMRHLAHASTHALHASTHRAFSQRIRRMRQRIAHFHNASAACVDV